MRGHFIRATGLLIGNISHTQYDYGHESPSKSAWRKEASHPTKVANIPRRTLDQSVPPSHFPAREQPASSSRSGMCWCCNLH